MTFETEVHILKMTLHRKSGHIINTPSSKLAFLVSSCWERNIIRNNAHIIDRMCCILFEPPYIDITYAVRLKGQIIRNSYQQNIKCVQPRVNVGDKSGVNYGQTHRNITIKNYTNILCVVEFMEISSRRVI